MYHGDLYRIENFHDFETLGLEDVFEKPAVVILEWAENFPLPSPWPQLRLKLEPAGGDKRRLMVLSVAHIALTLWPTSPVESSRAPPR